MVLRIRLPMALLLGVLTAAASAPLVGLGAYVLSHYAERQQRQEMVRVEEAAEALASAVDRELRAKREILEVLAANDSLRRRDIQRFRQNALEARAVTGANFVLTDPEYRQLVNTRAAQDGQQPEVSHRAAIDDVIEARRTLIGNLEIGTAQDQHQFSISTPIVFDGQVQYILSIVPAERAIQVVLAEHDRSSHWFASVLDGNGRIVARSSFHDVFYGRKAAEDFLSQLTGRSGIIETVDLEGRAAVTAFAMTRLANWRAVVWVPQATLLQPLRTALQWFWISSAVALVVSLAAAFTTGYLINRATRRTLKAADALGRGTPLHASVGSVVSEAHDIHSALIEAAESIRTREAQLRASEAHQKFLMQELSHRSMNLLTVVHAMARQTSRTASCINQFRDGFESRVASLARSHELLLAQDWSGVSLACLVGGQTTAVSGRCSISAEGPPIVLKPAAAQNIGMALHELVTNAAKHGALSVEGGQVAIEWSLSRSDGEERLVMKWSETGGPPAQRPERGGFGLIVLERAVASALEGRAELDWTRAGLVWVLDAPARVAVA